MPLGDGLLLFDAAATFDQLLTGFGDAFCECVSGVGFDCPALIGFCAFAAFMVRL